MVRLKSLGVPMHGERRARFCALSFGYWLTLATPALAQLTYQYDDLGRVTKVTDARAGFEQNYVYDALGNRVTVAQGQAIFTINDVTVTEGGTAVFTVTKTGSTSASINVSYATANNTAVQPGDYTAQSSSVTFAAADTTKTVSISTVDDTSTESTESFFVNLTGAPGGVISDNQGVGTINDNDAPPPPSFAISDATAAEGSTLSFTVTRTGTSSGSFSMNYAAAPGTATPGSDYTVTSGALTFANGEMSKTIPVAALADGPNEPSETLNVNLSSPTGGATLSDASGLGTITNVNSPPDAVDDVTGARINRVKNVAVLTNDTDPNPDILQITACNAPATVTCTIVSANTQVNLIGSALGTYSITYSIADGWGGTDSATITFNVVVF